MNERARVAKSGVETSSARLLRPHMKDAAGGLGAHLGNRTTRALLDSAASGRGRPLEAGVRKRMETSFNENFSTVRVHTPETLPQGVEAATAGQHIVFGRGQYAPHTERGRRLIAHELAHVVQQSRASGTGGKSPHLEEQADRAAGAALAGKTPFISANSTPALQFKIKPEDAASEMVGQTFEVTASYTHNKTTLASGDQVKVVTWDADKAHSVEVKVLTGKAKGQTLVVPQRILRPASASVSGVAPYRTQIASQAETVKKAEDTLATFQAQKPKAKTKKALQKFTEEEKRQQDLLAKRRDELNRREIQEQMYNRFDSIIAKEVAAANASHNLKGKDALDPNLVKAQLFEESELGTAGEHMSTHPTHPTKTRFNLGQVIDSSGLALLTFMEREQAALITKYKLANLRKELSAAQKEKQTLESMAHRGVSEKSRLNVLEHKAKQNWETFIWEYTATGQTQGFWDAVQELFASGTPHKNLDYKFWIHLAIMWLFEKKKSGMSWANAIKAYNGSGAKADHYKKAIVKRARKAVSAQGKGKDFFPTH